MKYSIFTPTHDPQFLGRTWASVSDQTERDWEWVIVPNKGAQVPDFHDARVKVVPYEHDNVGALKKFACSQCSGEWLVELDHDDELLPTCLEEIGKCDADFVYSNEVTVEGDFSPFIYGDGYGWEHRGISVRGVDLLETIIPEPHPTNVSRIWFSPYHVRAWRREFYERIGGHDENMFLDDDHDLVCRSVLYGRVKKIDKPLYIFYVRDDSAGAVYTVKQAPSFWDIYHRYFIALAEKWSRDNNLQLLDLGGALNPIEGYKTVDRHNADIICDLNEDWPIESQSVGLLRASNIIEHLHDPIHTMNEAWRVLAHGGVFDIIVPSTNGEGAFCDPTHVSFWNMRSFKYYTESEMRYYIEPDCNCRFQIIGIQEEIFSDGIPYVTAHLLAVHDGPRFHGVLLI